MIDVMGLPSSDVPDTWTKSTEYVDFENLSVKAFVSKALKGMDDGSDTDKAICLFNAVRDDMRYDPYQLGFIADEYKASYVAELSGAYCVPKAILLAACLRSVGIPAGVGFADVKNHLNSAKLADLMETDVFSYHGYVALKLGGQTFKVTPTFNRDLCERFGVRAIEFDATADALFHEYDAEKRKHMEYIKDRGIFENPPMQEILQDLGEIYTKMKAMRDSELQLEEDPEFAA